MQKKIRISSRQQRQLSWFNEKAPIRFSRPCSRQWLSSSFAKYTVHHTMINHQAKWFVPLYPSISKRFYSLASSKIKFWSEDFEVKEESNLEEKWVFQDLNPVQPLELPKKCRCCWHILTSFVRHGLKVSKRVIFSTMMQGICNHVFTQLGCKNSTSKLIVATILSRKPLTCK